MSDDPAPGVAERGEAPGVVAREGVVGTGPDRLFVREIGAGAPLVVVHGGPEFDHAYLVPELDRLAAPCHLVYYDQRGRGRSFPSVSSASP